MRASDAVDKLAKSLFNEQQRRTSRTYNALSIQQHTGIIEEDIPPNSVSFGRITLLRTEHRWLVTHMKDANNVMTIRKPTAESTVKDTKKATKDNSSLLEEYVVSRIMRHVDAPRRRRYTVRWYWIGPQEDFLDHAVHIPAHFVNRSWENQENRSSTHKQRWQRSPTLGYLDSLERYQPRGRRPFD